MLLDRITPPAPDAIIALMQTFRDDPRADKVDLGVGVYRDEAGQTPLMRAVATAEARIVARNATKAYVALTGDPAYLAAMQGLLLGGAVDAGRVAAAATPGGTGALHQALALVRAARPEASVWISDPSWPNHPAIAAAVGLGVRSYRYLDPATGLVDAPGMLSDLSAARPGDIVVLHAACHNPSGADPTPDQWAALADLLAERGLVPLVDVAYLGFGAGVEEDAGALRLLVARLPEVLVAASGSKTFGLYRDRVGVVLAICSDVEAAGRVRSLLATLNRTNFAFPPDHGARIATEVLTDPALHADWADELAGMRDRIAENRAALARALRERLQSDRFDFLTGHRGMFSLLGLEAAQITALREDHGVYLIADSRANLAGMRRADADRIAAAVAAVLHPDTPR